LSQSDRRNMISHTKNTKRTKILDKIDFSVYTLT